MKWKKYVGSSQEEAYLKVKEELGADALIISVKTVSPKGLAKMFKKPFVEVVATNDERFLRPKKHKKPEEHSYNRDYDDYKKEEKSNFTEHKFKQKNEYVDSFTPDNEEDYFFRQTKSSENYDRKNDFSKIEIKKANPEEIVKNMKLNFKEELEQAVPEIELEKKPELECGKDGVPNDFIQAIYEQLSENGVLEENINTLTEGAHGLDEQDKKEIVAIVYKRIVEVLSDYETIKKKDGNVIFFVGPTGVGKTTTIAKIASYFILNQGLKVALITADTYRIAAVEQLKMYANILNIPIKVIYNENELKGAIDEFRNFDLIFVDTAGRSHKNNERQLELAKLLNTVDKKDVFLLLSAATKFKDIASITKKYSDICDYKIIFTKLDETISYGNILNTKLLTGAKLSYVTFGQSVPEDIGMIKPAEIAKNILGGAK